MKQQSLLYAALCVIVAILVGMTILLQVAIVHDQRAVAVSAAGSAAVNGVAPGKHQASPQKSLLARVREQIALALLPVRAAPAPPGNDYGAVTRRV